MNKALEKMITAIEDSINIDANDKIRATYDFHRMVNDPIYASKVGYKSINRTDMDLSQILKVLFIWPSSDLKKAFWINIYNKLLLM